MLTDLPHSVPASHNRRSAAQCTGIYRTLFLLMGIYNLELQPNEILINIFFHTYPSVYADSIPRLEPHWPTLRLKHTKGFLSQDPSSYSPLCLERSSPRKLHAWSSQRPQRVFPGFPGYIFYICLPLSHPCLS